MVARIHMRADYTGNSQRQHAQTQLADSLSATELALHHRFARMPVRHVFCQRERGAHCGRVDEFEGNTGRPSLSVRHRRDRHVRKW